MVRGVGGETKSEKFNVCQQACDDAAPIMRCSRFLIVCAVIAAAACAACGGAGSPAGAEPSTSRTTRYEDLRALFTDWRAFQQPRLADGVPDYSAEAMAAQQRELPAYERRLHAIDPAGWPVSQQVDWHIVRAE